MTLEDLEALAKASLEVAERGPQLGVPWFSLDSAADAVLDLIRRVREAEAARDDARNDAAESASRVSVVANAMVRLSVFVGGASLADVLRDPRMAEASIRGALAAANRLAAKAHRRAQQAESRATKAERANATLQARLDGAIAKLASERKDTVVWACDRFRDAVLDAARFDGERTAYDRMDAVLDVARNFTPSERPAPQNAVPPLFNIGEECDFVHAKRFDGGATIEQLVPAIVRDVDGDRRLILMRDIGREGWVSVTALRMPPARPADGPCPCGAWHRPDEGHAAPGEGGRMMDDACARDLSVQLADGLKIVMADRDAAIARAEAAEAKLALVRELTLSGEQLSWRSDVLAILGGE